MGEGTDITRLGETAAAVGLRCDPRRIGKFGLRRTSPVTDSTSFTSAETGVRNEVLRDRLHRAAARRQADISARVQLFDSSVDQLGQACGVPVALRCEPRGILGQPLTEPSCRFRRLSHVPRTNERGLMSQYAVARGGRPDVGNSAATSR